MNGRGKTNSEEYIEMKERISDNAEQTAAN